MNTQIMQFIYSIPAPLHYFLLIPAALFALTLHEFCHGFAAYKLGDPTAKIFGRLSMNPLRHLDPIGAVCMVFFHVGWERPVPINARYFRNPKRDMAITAVAGPISNIVISFLCVPVYLLIIRITADMVLSSLAVKVVGIILYLFSLSHILNLGLGLFNLIPIPPLDGSRIFLAFLPSKWYFKVMIYERYIALVLIILVYLGSFSGFISGAVSFISDLMFNAFSFIT